MTPSKREAAMTWMDDLREELGRRQVVADASKAGWGRSQAPAAADEAVVRVDALVRTFYNQMNQALLGGRGSVRDAPATWGVHLWELWWEPRNVLCRFVEASG